VGKVFFLAIDIIFIIGLICSNNKWVKASGTPTSLFLFSWLFLSRHQLQQKKENKEKGKDKKKNEGKASGNMKFCPTITIKLFGGSLG
jgi:hypothetical protein